MKITVAHPVKSICQKPNSLFVKEQRSGERLLKQLFSHYKKKTISQNLQGQTYLNSWKQSNYKWIKAMDTHYPRYEIVLAAVPP